MNIGGWIIMLLSVAGVTALFGWSLYLTLTRTEEPDPHLHSTLDAPADLDKD